MSPCIVVQVDALTVTLVVHIHPGLEKTPNLSLQVKQHRYHAQPTLRMRWYVHTIQSDLAALDPGHLLSANKETGCDLVRDCASNNISLTSSLGLCNSATATSSQFNPTQIRD